MGDVPQDLRKGLRMKAPLCHLTFHFTPEQDVVVPPFTSKVSKTILIQLLGDGSLISGIREPGGLLRKPLVVSPVMAGGRPLFKLQGQGGFMVLRAGHRYSFAVSAIGSLASEKFLNCLLDGLPRDGLKLFNARVSILGVDVVIRDLLELCLPEADAYRMAFRTPTVLQYPRPWRWWFKDENRYCLFPHPHLIIWSLARHWNSLVPPDMKVPDVHRLACYASYALVETDYDVRPITVVYERDGTGPRAFVGWVLFEHRVGNAKLDRRLRVLLDYANYVGVGKSRSIGFGMVEVRPIRGG